MILLQSGVDLLTIQAWLSYAQVATTHRYAAADVEMMRRGLDKAGIRVRQSRARRPAQQCAAPVRGHAIQWTRDALASRPGRTCRLKHSYHY